MSHHIDRVLTSVLVFECVAELQDFAVLLEAGGTIDEVLEAGEGLAGDWGH